MEQRGEVLQLPTSGTLLEHVDGPLAARRATASSGPPSVESESSIPRTAFALTGSCGDLASAGSRAVCGGRNIVTATVATIANP